MSDYIIATSSTSDLPRTWLEEHNIPFIAYSYTVNDEPREDDCREETRAAVYAGMRRGDKLHTSMINEFVYYDFLKTFLDEGKDVIFLDMSQKMSVSFVNANKAADKLRAEFPERKLYVMDTLCISGGLGLLVMNMVRRKEAGAGFDEVVAHGVDVLSPLYRLARDHGTFLNLRIAHRFTVDNLNYLKEGGRVSNSAALVGSILDIKPVLYVPNAGTLDVAQKVRGRKAALRAIRDGILHDFSECDPTGTEIHILQADCVADAEWVRDEIRKAYPQVGEITITALGVVIGAHCGPGLLTVFYLCNGRQPK